MQSILDRISSKSKPVTALVPEIGIPGHSCPKPADPANPAPQRPHFNAVAMSARIVGPDQEVPNLKGLEATHRGVPTH
jgi:hypothetical protein